MVDGPAAAAVQVMAAACRAAAGMAQLGTETVRVAEEAPQEQRGARVAREAAGVRVWAPVALEEVALPVAEATVRAVAVVVDQELEGGLEKGLEAAGASRPTTKSSPFCER
jgi:hypothetical protein